MTFDEAWKKIDEDSFPFEIPDEASDSEILQSDLIYVFEELRKKYAPIVELTQEQKNVWDIAVDASNQHPKDFIFFVDMLENVDEFHGYVFEEKLTKFRHNSGDLINMWLHPETIKVVGNIHNNQELLEDSHD
ncbi:MAG: hypothetical protein ABF690_15380 [Liquorilactobacillus nagelii]|uniref:hypothetical protein n=1 Tax=Liquorilactobacillus satsumensis TaxID=259059 RepID=UPI00345CA35C